MNSRNRCLTIAACIFFLIALAACKKGGGDGGGVQGTGDVSIAVSSPSGNCSQAVGGSAVNMAEVDPNKNATWAGPAVGSTCSINFTSCPFSSCPVSCGQSYQATGTPGTDYHYSEMSINGQGCTLPASPNQLGLRIKPSPIAPH